MLRNKLVDTIAFLENLSLKDSSEKDTFFKRLPSAVPQIPLPVAQLKLLPMLAGERRPCMHIESRHQSVDDPGGLISFDELVPSIKLDHMLTSCSLMGC